MDGFGFDLLSSLDDGFGPAEIDIGGCEVAQTLVKSMVVECHPVFDDLYGSLSNAAFGPNCGLRPSEWFVVEPIWRIDMEPIVRIKMLFYNKFFLMVP